MKSHTPQMLTGIPTVTVAIPCYNYGHLLPGAVSAALEQEHVSVDVLIIDDASPDGSLDVARDLVRSDPRIRLIEHQLNQGHIATYNEGIRDARGEYFVLISADDLLAAGALSRACSLFESDNQIVMVYGWGESFSGTPPPNLNGGAERWTVWEGDEWAAMVYHYGTNIVFSPEIVVRTSAQVSVGGYDSSQPHAGDLNMWLRVASLGRVGHLAGPTQALYRIHPENMHSSVFATDQATGMVRDLQARELAFRGAVSSFFDGDSMYLAARAALAREAVDLASRAYVWGLTDTWPVERLVQFATEMDPGIVRTTEWRAFARRRSLGRRLSHRNPLFVPREWTLRRREAARDQRRRKIGV